MKNNVQLSKKMSYVLRHHPESIGIQLDDFGWTDTEILCQKLLVDRADVEGVVETTKKETGSRFRFSEDFTKIKANQGHSVPIKNDMEAVNPPFILYHGTNDNVTHSILMTGLKKMSRLHVHLSKDTKAAKEVAGRRKGKNIILEIEAKAMYADGIDIFLSENGYYLTDFVDPKYIKIHKEDE